MFGNIRLLILLFKTCQNLCNLLLALQIWEPAILCGEGLKV